MKRNTLVQESLKNLSAVLFAVAVILPSSVFAEDADPCGRNPSLNFK
ncbi:MAG: hypothetical protein MJY99_06735 [Fibrobacter sp.]|nr:hypothetical protein [Fibrobacter sp.]